MSTAADCYFIEVAPGKWSYKIQEWPYGEWPEYETNGPFNSFAEALYHLDDNYANPGGWSTKLHPNHVHQEDEHDKGFCFACGERV